MRNHVDLPLLDFFFCQLANEPQVEKLHYGLVIGLAEAILSKTSLDTKQRSRADVAVVRKLYAPLYPR